MKGTQKALRSRTIIPDELYVDRDADRQLSRVVDEMGRPAYILVARQMGKTNLLLRMKRGREKLGEIAVYVDLSIGFNDARSLFRHLIDSLAENVISADVINSIKAEREQSSLDPSIEFDRHLRRILTALSREKVIIILDEIDSLVGQSYSDRVLSQIRSMYFARANFSIYERLTYVLSGVAEPTDLIKDKNISPFNIGEKIYLNDFSALETSTLLEKAGLRFSKDVEEAVYSWIRGNPRMTWDVYSALEDEFLASENVTAETVETVIQKLYLTRYDRAPLDHIRALAENDVDVRAALIALLYGKGGTLDDRAKSKLYLAGITTASVSKAPHIKNRVIEFALSEDWLAQVEAGRKGLLIAASRRYAAGEYSEAVDLFKQYLDSGTSIDTLNEIEVFEYGMVLYHAGDYGDAVSILERANKLSRSAELRLMINYHIGLSSMLLGKIDEAIEVMTPLATNDGPYKLRAKHALGTAYLTASIKDNAEKIIRINEEVLDETNGNGDLTDEEKSELVSAAHYNLGQVYRARGQREQAKAAFEMANSSALPAKKPAFASARLRATADPQEREAILREVSEVLSTEDVPYSTSRGLLGFDEKDIAELLVVSIELSQSAIFQQLLQIATQKSSKSSFETLVALATETDWDNDAGDRSALLRRALTDPTVAGDAILRQRLYAATIWLAQSDANYREEAFRTYWSLVSDPAAVEFLSANDTVALANQVAADLQNGNVRRAKQITQFVRTNEDTFAVASSTMFAFFVYQEMVVHRMEANFERVLKSAHELLRLVSKENLTSEREALKYSSMIDELRSAAFRQINLLSPSSMRFGRNDYVNVIDRATGIQTRAKYKKIADRLARGELEIVPDNRRKVSLNFKK
jgi:tetratricopeptide (TPR) repeat protein